MFSIFLFLCLPTSQALPFFWSEFYHIRFGDISNFDDLMLPNITDNEDITEPIPSNAKILSFSELIHGTNQIGDLNKIMESFKSPVRNSSYREPLHDEKKINDLNNEIYNITRRSQSQMWSWSWTHHGFEDNADSPPSQVWEYRKIGMMQNYGLQLLTHARHKIAQALFHRTPVRSDKRYRLGYLFCTVRRILTEMLKFSATAKEQYNIWWTRRVYLNLRLYEEVIMMEQDIKDIIEYIKEIYLTKTSADYNRIRIKSRKEVLIQDMVDRGN